MTTDNVVDLKLVPDGEEVTFEFAPGEVVMLASGGPPLTVVAEDREIVTVGWFRAGAHYEEREIPAWCLVSLEA